MVRRGGYKGLAAGYKRKATKCATTFIYHALGGQDGDKRISRKNPTTGYIAGSYQRGKYSIPKESAGSRSKRVIQYNEEHQYVRSWDNAKWIEECSEREFKASGVQKACREGKMYKGYYWEYE